MTFPASQIAALINGKIEGDPNTSIASFGKIEEAGEGQLSFFSNPRYEEFLYTTKASAIIVGSDYVLKQPITATLIRVENPYLAFAELLSKYEEMMRPQLSGIQELSYIDPSATCGEKVFVGSFAYLSAGVNVGNNTRIYPQVYIGKNVRVGSNCTIYPGVKIYHDCVIGNNVIIQAGAVIGSDGFGFAPLEDGTLKKIPQIGNVVIEDDVEVGANSTIDRATMGSTIIKKGAKLDNLIQIGHNTEIGYSTVIAAQAGVSGSTKIGNGVMIGGQAGIVGHIQLGDGAKVNAQSGVTKSVDAGKAVTGSPAFDYTATLRSQAASRRLPDLEKRVKQLEELIRQLLEEKASV